VKGQKGRAWAARLASAGRHQVQVQAQKGLGPPGMPRDASKLYLLRSRVSWSVWEALERWSVGALERWSVGALDKW
jgi:hypothetical protein